MTLSFSDLKLGYTDATTEGKREPRLLLEGYLDADNLVKELLFGEKFLVLGYKGSGKSAIGQHLDLTSKLEREYFVNSVFLSDLNYAELNNIIRTEGAAEVRHPTAWSWLLLVMLYSSFLSDTESPSFSDPHFYSTFEALVDMGLISATHQRTANENGKSLFDLARSEPRELIHPDLSRLVSASARKSFKVRLPPLFETEFERNVQGQNLQLPFFIDKMKKVACAFRSEKQHLLIIDGLDDVLMSKEKDKEVQYVSLASLVLAASRMNEDFYSNRTPAKIILLCRTDLYEKLPGANTNKLRQDSAITLNWYHDAELPDMSNLIKLVNQKSKVNHPEVEGLFDTFFPAAYVFKTKERKEIKRFLLEQTRHTPRDFIQLLKKIQDVAKTPGKITIEQINSALESYSTDFFLTEIENELSGYFDRKDIEGTMMLIRNLRQKTFSFDQLVSEANNHSRYTKLDLSAIVDALFECGAIGNVFTNENGETTVVYKYSNRRATPNLTQMLRIHKGLTKALGLP